MKTILVCGSRDWKPTELIRSVLEELTEKYTQITVIHGGCRGVDQTAGDVCFDLKIDCQVFPAKWHIFGAAAGPIRNQQMLEEGNPDIVIAFHRDLENSKGTKHMVKIAREANVHVILYDCD